MQSFGQAGLASWHIAIPAADPEDVALIVELLPDKAEYVEFYLPLSGKDRPRFFHACSFKNAAHRAAIEHLEGVKNVFVMNLATCLKFNKCVWWSSAGFSQNHLGKQCPKPFE